MESNSFENAKRDGYFIHKAKCYFDSKNSPEDGNYNKYYQWCKQNDRAFIVIRNKVRYSDVKVDLDTMKIERVSNFTEEERKELLDHIASDFAWDMKSYYGFPALDEFGRLNGIIIASVAEEDSERLAKYVLNYFDKRDFKS